MTPFEAFRHAGQDGRTTLVVRGELDLATAHHVVTRAKEWAAEVPADTGPQGSIQLDLSGVTFLDSTGLGALIETRSIALAAGRAVELCAASAAVERVLALAGLTSLFAEPAGGQE
ncbi:MULTISPECIES: STAS domain-containing protein [Mumia]|uniref:Anti-sigma factor antagonist n=1 Tax=Mumia xiangluensis TaxID=1678900 RepID=A0ABW1QK28_9ACTN|nr:MULTISPECIES: STAS domain-containing protein [Mumia]